MILRLICCLLPATLLAETVGTWPEFRGPQRDGTTPAKSLPLEWSDEKNVVWKTAVTGKAWSTPLVNATQVWLSNATEDGKEMSVVCLDRATGKVLHDAVLFRNATTEPLGNPVNGYASPTGLLSETDALVHFGSYGTAAFDSKTFKVKWERRDLPCRHYRGPGSSLFAYKNLVILTMDGVDVQYLVALDRATGKTIWKSDRSTAWNDLDEQGKPKAEGDMRKAYTTPLLIVFPDGAEHLVSTGSKATIAYDPATGKELWQVTYDGFSNASSPVYRDGVVYFNTGYTKSKQIALPVNSKSRGNLTENIKWTQTKRMPLRTTPLTLEVGLFTLSDDGHASLLDYATGEPIWSERLGDLFSGSPLLVEDRILCVGENGHCFWIAPTKSFQLLGQNKLPSGMLASPVAVDDSLFLRTRTHCYRIRAAK
jgi:outer membrane protein assembly factor BamB